MDEYKSVEEVLDNLILVADEVKLISKDTKKFWKNPKYKNPNLNDIRSFQEGIEQLGYRADEIKDSIKRINQLKKQETSKAKKASKTIKNPYICEKCGGVKAINYGAYLATVKGGKKRCFCKQKSKA